MELDADLRQRLEMAAASGRLLETRQVGGGEPGPATRTGRRASSTLASESIYLAPRGQPARLDHHNQLHKPSSRHKRPPSEPTAATTTTLARLATGAPAYDSSVARPRPLAAISVLVVLVALIIQIPAPGPAFNIDTQAPIVHSGPSGSQFGYSVALHRDRGAHWLLVGAPRAKTDQPQTSDAGAVYGCASNSPKACHQIPFDLNGSTQAEIKSERLQTDDKSRQGFGSSLASATDNGSIVACAPRYVYYSTNLRRRDPVGSCWVSRGSFGGSFVAFEFSPCRQNDMWGHHHLGSCQAGFSSAISRDGGRLFTGAPGSHVWQGQVFARNLRTDLTNSTSPVNPHSEDDSYLGYSLALGRFSPQTTGAQEAGSGSLVDVAIGIPRGHQLAGKIMIVDREMRPLRNISGEQMGAYFGYALISADINGDGLDDLIIGAPNYFNQATSHKEPHFDRGRVYVAVQSSGHDFSIVQRLDGQRNRARFGSSLANLGDLNRDGLQDVAVGAPYDGPEQRGAVYVYLGRRRAGSGALSDEPDQVIYAEDISRSALDLAPGAALKSFGWALSGGLDVDANQYPDLLVGAHESDRAVLLRARPVVNVTSSFTFTPENFNLDDKSCLLPNSSASVACITVQYCTKYTGLNVDQRLSFVYEIKLDTENKGAPRLFFLNNEGKNEDRLSQLLSKDANHCKSFKAYLVRQIRDKLTPLKIDIDYNLADYAGDTFDYSLAMPKLRPVLNKLTPNKLTKSASIQKNCGPDNVCVPDLKLTVNPNIDQYTIGSQERLVLDVTVKNYGEDAYESMFYLTMPMTIDFITINKSRADYPVCYGAKPDQTGVNVLTCDLGNPQVRNDVVKFSVITEPARNGHFMSPDFTFLAMVNSTNPEQDERSREDNQVAIGIPIKVEVQLVLSGSSQPSLIVHNSTLHQLGVQQNRHDVTNHNQALISGRTPMSMDSTLKASEADIGPEVYHTYQLQNRGPSTINDIALTILWPTKTNDGKYLLYLVDEPFTDNKVVCKPAPELAINPLNLRYLRDNSLPASEIGTSNASTATTTNQIVNNYYYGNNNYHSNHVARFKRQNEHQVPSNNQQPVSTTTTITKTSTTVDNSILQQLNLLNCDPKQCTHFECNVYNLGHNEIVKIRIRSRLYEDTISELSLQKFDISSKLVAQVKTLPYNVSSQSMPPYWFKVETQVHTTGIAFQDILPWWLIFVAILLGVLLFVLLACFLRYLGFFARRRPPKGAEREPLTPTMWNDYHYTPGDTAL